MTAQSAAEALRQAFATGSYHQLADHYAEQALFDASLVGGRYCVRGPGAIAAALAREWGGPAELVEWTARVHPAGFELWAERVGTAGASRTRQYVWVEDGRIARHWIYSAPPRTPPRGQSSDARVRLDTQLLAGLGEVVEHESMISRGWSGNAVERLVLADGRKLVAKRIAPGSNWMDHHTADEGREALLFKSGVMARLPWAIDHTILAAERDGDAWWVVMKDVSHLLLPDQKRLSRDESVSILAAANGMWEEFWGEEVPHLCSLPDFFRLFSPTIAEAERAGLDLLPKQYEVFWEAFAEAVDSDVAEGVLNVQRDPGPFITKLEALGTTLIHADIRDEHLGFAANRVILLDWGRATQGHPVLDFAWSMCHNGSRTDATNDELVDDFRRVRGDHDDPRANELIGLAGLLMYGWVFGHSATYHPDPAEREWARKELAWWVPQTRRGLEAIGVA
ncbi:MAG: phosphotransferase [Solirubrobacteraceae bacterium]